MPPLRRRSNLPLNRDTGTTRMILKNVQENAKNLLQDFILSIENFILDAIQTQITPTLHLKYYKSEFSQPQILKDGKIVQDQRFSVFSVNGYYILKNHRKYIKDHLQDMFPGMTWRTELGNDYMGVMIGNYGSIDDVFSMGGIKEEENTDIKNDTEKDEKKCKGLL